MTPKAQNLTSLIGSRICHDLISPIGAISNGMELLSLSGAMAGPELALIEDSVAQANARIRFFRLAFGIADAAPVTEAEVVEILRGYAGGARVSLGFHVTGAQPRNEVRLVFLAILCLETALPFGGKITVHREADHWHISGISDRVQSSTPAWRALLSGQLPEEITPGTVQFVLLPEGAGDLGRMLTVDKATDGITIRF
ncbi:histidine phosphotransferase family protein [Aestuariivita boseongensis]|uniref:histidine phosphotransferase family protein n=1 Tax=Aestuariivita boseongensis TaxID=1470562 RepID=UPI0006803673|nr:histidine phosphotransferase family protein [Aestuariivita boseongensis]